MTIVPTRSARFELRLIKLSQVVGVDEGMLATLKEANLSPFLPVDCRLWKQESLVRFLDEYPFMVRSSAKGYFCIGGFRRFLLAQAVFAQDPDHELHVLFRQGKLSTPERGRLIGQECFLAPAIERADRSNAPHYYRLWDKLSEEFSPIIGKREGDFDRAMGFLPRNKKKDR